MLYHYTAIDESGQILEADFEADTLGQVLQHLQGRELRPLDVKPIQKRKVF